MLKRLITFFLIVITGVFYASADVSFSIRYYDKNIYYPGDPIELKLTLTNTAVINAQDESFYLASDLRHSFGFNLRTLTGEVMDPAEGFAMAVNNPGAYRVLNLSPGQELSMVVTLNDWVDIPQAEQYRLEGFFYPGLRGLNMKTLQAETVLDLNILPETDNTWKDQIDDSVRRALISRDLDPVSTVLETIENHSMSRFNRAIIYLDIESLTRNLPAISSPDILEKSLIRGSWRLLPGLDLPLNSFEVQSSQVYRDEAIVFLTAEYNTYGEVFERDLRFYLHKKDGYWSIRRIETLPMGISSDTTQNFRIHALHPAEVISTLIDAVTRGDWDVVFRYYRIEDLVMNLPEYSYKWKNMSSTEHQLALTDYRQRIIDGELDSGLLPLTDLEDWKIISVNYTDVSGSVVVMNTKVYPTNAGPLKQKNQYTFRLSRPDGSKGSWIVVRYDSARISE